MGRELFAPSGLEQGHHDRVRCSLYNLVMTSEAVPKPHRTLSLFTGAGGLDIGFERNGAFASIAYAELEPVFCETLRRNWRSGLLGDPDTEIVETDLARSSPKALLAQLGLDSGSLDVLLGGPPCQTFSTAGRRRSVEDPRGTLLWTFLDYIVEARPRFFCMENVRGLLSAALRHRPIAERPGNGGPLLDDDEKPGSVVALWIEDLMQRTNGQYRVDCFEVNAVNYGAPQLRERVLFIGNREGKVAQFPEPTHGAVDPGSGKVPNGKLPFATLRDALAGFSESTPVSLDFSPRKKRYLSLVPPGGNWRSLPPEVAEESMGKAFRAKGGRSGWWRRLSWDLPSPTIVTMPNHASTAMCHPDEVRALSVGECARIQGFPDGWEFAGTVQEQMTQIGNAVPTKLGEVAAETIRMALAAPACTEQEAEVFRRVYLHSHVRTRQWFRKGKPYIWDGIGGSAHYRPTGAGREAA